MSDIGVAYGDVQLVGSAEVMDLGESPPGDLLPVAENEAILVTLLAVRG